MDKWDNCRCFVGPVTSNDMKGEYKKAINCFHGEIKTRTFAVTRTEYGSFFQESDNWNV